MAGGEKIRCGTAPSGVKYALRRSSGQVSWCALSIGAGTRDEAGFPAGIAHFTEHNIFRGTSRKSAKVISSYLDRLGGELNAFTTKEEIVLHATVLRDDLPKAVGLLFELATDSVLLGQLAISSEAGEAQCLSLGKSMLAWGEVMTSASVKKIKPDMLRRFVREKFIPSRMALSVVADIDLHRLEKQILKSINDVFPQGN